MLSRAILMNLLKLIFVQSNVRRSIFEEFVICRGGAVGL